MRRETAVNVEKIRAQVPALSNFVWFQNGFVSLTPTPIAEEHVRLMRELYEKGPMHLLHPDVELPRRAASVERIAQFLHVDTSEVALKLAVSDGFNTVLNGIEWNAGDEIIITDEEAAAILGPSLHLEQTRGTKTVKAPLIDDIEGQVSAVADRITDRTRLIAFSHVTTETGFRLPAAQVCRIARERGVLTFADVAHSVGLYDIDLHEMDCDFAGVSNYKWTYSPYACGVLYVRRDSLGELQYAASPNRGLNLIDPVEDVLEVPDSAMRLQSGPWSWPLVHTWAFALDWLSDVGLEAIWERTAALTGRLKRALVEIPGLTLFTPMSADLSAALVTFHLEGWDSDDLVKQLKRRWNIEIKSVPMTWPRSHDRPVVPSHAVRASLAFFLLEEEIDLLAGAVKQLASERA